MTVSEIIEKLSKIKEESGGNFKIATWDFEQDVAFEVHEISVNSYTGVVVLGGNAEDLPLNM